VTPALQRIDPALEREQNERLRAVRASRDEAAWSASLDRLEAAARSSDNIVPAMIEAVKARATLGEISDRLRQVWGEYREVVTV
jgi:methylmalonyl-CoA mutase N-terminal domain/subunit